MNVIIMLGYQQAENGHPWIVNVTSGVVTCNLSKCLHRNRTHFVEFLQTVMLWMFCKDFDVHNVFVLITELKRTNNQVKHKEFIWMRVVYKQIPIMMMMMMMMTKRNSKQLKNKTVTIYVLHEWESLTCTRTGMCVYMCVCVYVSVSVHVCVCVRARARARVCVCVWEREREREREIDWLMDWLIDWTLFLNGEDISTKADSHICCCYSTTNNQDIHSEILW